VIDDETRPAVRTFVLLRDVDVSGVSGVGKVAEGVEFTDGTVALRWLDRGNGTPSSVVFWDHGLRSVERVHGHDGHTRIVFLPAFGQ
jgi:hypothetical protein